MAAPSTLFPTLWRQVLVFLVEFLGVTIITHCLSRAFAAEKWTAEGLKRLTPARFFILVVFISSWLFIFCNALLTFGLSLEYTSAACNAAQRLCTIFYGTSKVFIYLFLAEKVRVVWSPTSVPRFRSKMYNICVISLILYIIPVVVMFVGSNHEFREGDGSCLFSLRNHAAIYILAYDSYITIFFTALFLWPIFKSTLRNRFIRRIAMRTLITSVVVLLTSTGNVIVLALFQGHELGWLCLATCSIDVLVNTVALFWVAHCGSKNEDSSDADLDSKGAVTSLAFRSSITQTYQPKSVPAADPLPSAKSQGLVEGSESGSESIPMKEQLSVIDIKQPDSLAFAATSMRRGHRTHSLSLPLKGTDGLDGSALPMYSAPTPRPRSSSDIDVEALPPFESLH